jgi:hypothetical protein
MLTMTSLTLRRAAGAAIACVLGLACSGNKPPVPNGFIQAFIGPGNGGSSVCGYQAETQFIQIGEPTDTEPGTESNGDFQNPGTVMIDCKVDKSGGGNFNIRISAEVNGPMGGSVVIQGTVSATGGSNIVGGFTSSTNGTFSDNNCTIAFTYNMQPVSGQVGTPLDSGRIWAHLSCPNATQSGTSEIGDDGGATQRTCDGEADFLFQNCD